MKTFVRGEIAPSWWANALDGVLRDYIGNVVLRRASGAPTTTVEVPASAGADGRAALAIDGFWRWNEAAVQRAHPGGVAGTYVVWAVTGPQTIVNVPDANTDTTNYSFDLRITLLGTQPSVVAGVLTHWREIGRCAWNGTAITWLSQSGEPFTDTQVSRLIEVAGSSSIPVRSVLEVGQVGQTRAGRVLTATDFTELGLAAPLGLWLASTTTQTVDQGGSLRNLTNKGAVPFVPGITGTAGEAAQFAGSTAQALYRDDTGAADPFRIRTGSFGGWSKTAKRTGSQQILAKMTAAAGQFGWWIETDSTLSARVNMSTDGTAIGGVAGTTDICDDRWHFIAGTFDGSALRVYVDGNLEGVTVIAGLIHPSSGPLNIGARAADAVTAASLPHFGKVDEVFVTADVLTEDQVRLLYAVKIPHGATTTPRRAGLTVRRRRRGAVLASADFPSQPLRLYNISSQTSGYLDDLGSNDVTLTNAVGGVLVAVSGPDGKWGPNGALNFAGAHAGLTATDAGLPAALTSRSYGIWFKATLADAGVMLGWGTIGTADARLNLGAAAGKAQAANGADFTATSAGSYNDGQWHHAVSVEDNAAGGGVKRKLYVDGRLVGISLVMNSITLAGANRFRIGASPDGTSAFTGQLARAFVHAAALTAEQVQVLYQKGSQDLGLSPKNPGDHVERIDATNIYFIGDDLEPQHQVELEVSA